MAVISLILSIGVLFFVIQLMSFQKRYDFLNGITITAALIVVLLDIDTLTTGREYQISTLISLAVLGLWIFNTKRKPLEA